VSASLPTATAVGRVEQRRYHENEPFQDRLIVGAKQGRQIFGPRSASTFRRSPSTAAFSTLQQREAAERHERDEKSNAPSYAAGRFLLIRIVLARQLHRSAAAGAPR
jgi:hypothetical protein